MTVHIHPSVDSGVKKGTGSFAGGTLVCKCKDRPVKVGIKGDVAHNHACGCTKCWKPAGTDFSIVAVVPRDKLQVTQNDVRAIQLAKAALYAGIRLLMDHLGVTAVDRIRLAGAFGSHIDVKYAMVLGMLPDCDLSEVSSAGNAAGAGARIALLDSASRSVIEGLVRRVEKIETAIEPKFQAHFVAAMGIPHSTEPYAQLRRVVQLPAAKATPARSGARGRRRASAEAKDA